MNNSLIDGETLLAQRGRIYTIYSLKYTQTICEILQLGRVSKAERYSPTHSPLRNKAKHSTCIARQPLPHKIRELSEDWKIYVEEYSFIRSQD